jgi:hypothetical protein
VPGLIPRRRPAAWSTALDDAMAGSASLLLPGRVTGAWHPRDNYAARSPRVSLLAFVRVNPPVWSPHVHRLIRTRERLSATGAGPQRRWSYSWTAARSVSMPPGSGRDAWNLGHAHRPIPEDRAHVGQLPGETARRFADRCPMSSGPSGSRLRVRPTVPSAGTVCGDSTSVGNQIDHQHDHRYLRLAL